MKAKGWIGFWLVLVLVPAAAALPLNVHISQDVDVPVLPKTGIDVDIATDQPIHESGAEVCAVGRCLETGRRTVQDDYSASTQRMHSTEHADAEAGVVGSQFPLTEAVAGASIAAILAFVTKWWLVGPGRFMAWAAGPLNLLWGLSSRVALTPDLENPTRARILTYLQQHPGASIQDVRKAMDVAWGTAVYHLQRLERTTQVVSVQEGNSHRYWVEGTSEAAIRRAWMVLEQPTARMIARTVRGNPGIHQGGICERLALGGPTASKHLKRLVTKGLVEAQRCSRYMLYKPTPRLDQAFSVWDQNHDAMGLPPSAP